MKMSIHGGEIREGFLCPMCMKDLGTVSQLQSHFEEAHSKEDRAALNQLRNLFDRAKKKFLGDKDVETVPENSKAVNSSEARACSLYDVDYWQVQDVGVTRNQKDSFRGFRDSRVDRYVVETNKLLIRLDKLISDTAPSDASKRKAFEKSVVMWTPDRDVKNCRFCSHSFGITRRRHHCRLCGGIMCHRCSQFLPYTYAKKLINPSFHCDGGKAVGFLKRTGSSSSLDSMFSTDGEPHIRCCLECRTLLEHRDQQAEQRNYKSAIEKLYEKMKTCIQECENVLQSYLPMVASLSTGESTYSLFEAQKRRQELVKRYDIIDQLSKRIRNEGLDSEQGPSPKQELLQKAVRLYAANFMQENMMGLEQLPSEEQYAELQRKRTDQIRNQIAQERKAAFIAQAEEKKMYEKDKVQTPSKDEWKTERSGSQKHTRNSSQGWKPSEQTVRMTSGDPMLQQIEIIKGYIKQAKQAQKWDEVNMLEQNLKDLLQEYSCQQNQS